MKDYILTDEIVFDSKPDAVPYSYRISYKLAQISLIIYRSCSAKSGCSLIKLHILSHSLNSKSYMENLKQYVEGVIPYILVRFDPSINRAVKYALAEELIIQLKNGTFKLAEKGKMLVLQIEEDKELMIKEKEFLGMIGKKLTNEKIEELLLIWGIRNAEDK